MCGYPLRHHHGLGSGPFSPMEGQWKATPAVLDPSLFLPSFMLILCACMILREFRWVRYFVLGISSGFGLCEFWGSFVILGEL